MNKNKLLMLSTLSIPAIMAYPSQIEVNAVETKASVTVNNCRIENVTDEGFDFIIKFNSNEEVTSAKLPYWKMGNYNGMSNNNGAIQRIGYNEFKLHIKMSDIGSGTEYVYVGVHAITASGSVFVKDLAIKLDNVSPNLTLTSSNTNWTNQNISVKAVSTDNQNIIENIYFYDKNNNVTKTEMYSSPKLLIIKGNSSSGIADKFNGKSNATIVTGTSIENVSQLIGYDIVIYDGRYWSIDNRLANLLNQAFEEGISLITNMNDSPGNLSITTGSTGGYSGSYTFSNNNNNKGLQDYYAQGRLNRFAYLINGMTESDSGYHTTNAGAGAFVISNRSYGDGKPMSPGVLMKTHSKGNKWIHVQGSDVLPNHAINRAIDEIMHGTMKTRQTYNKSFNITENGTYSVEVEDFSGNKTKKSITVNNIDKTLPTATITGNPTSWVKTATLTITGADTQSGVKSITLPNGTVVNGSTANYTVTANGNYSFKITDNAGNVTTQSITVSKIDNSISTLNGVSENMTMLDTSTSNRRMTFTFNPVSDTQSGIKGYSYVIDKNPTTVPDNTINTTGTTITKDITDTGIYYLHLKAIDNAGNVSNVIHHKVDVPNLKAQSKPTENKIRLDWTMNDLNGKTFKVYQKKPGSSSFQSISTTNLSTATEVKVLNVYPNKGNNLKTWMETNGYGKGIIRVDEVTIDNFNTNPDSYLKNSDGSYKYDVIMFGTWDANNYFDISTTARDSVDKFIAEGRGVLFGHDTTCSNNNWANFTYLGNKYLNMIKGGVDSGRYSSVTVTKKGLLTNYPWNIGDLGTQLTIPITHSYGQSASGDIWMRYTGSDTATNNFYLTTWNNVAMIQTGHSNAQATPDEQKLLANTLFYLNQLSSDNFLDDNSGQDVKAPNKPTLNSQTINSNGTISFNLNPATDNGSTYEYYVESQTKDNDSLSLSNVVKNTITSGLKGYSFVIDTNATTIPDNTVDTTSTNITANITSNTMYLHVKAIDNVGNVSETLHVKVSDTTAPTMNITGNPTAWTNQNVTLNVTASDVGTGVKHIVLPNGNIVNGTTASYTVSANGNYTFKVVDKMGNTTTQTVNVSKIDKSISNVGNLKTTMEMLDTTTSSRKIIATFSPVSDSGSGLKGYSYIIDKNPTTVPDNTINTTSTRIEKTITDTGVYYLHIKAIDNVNNISSIIHHKIDIPNLSANVDAVNNKIRLDWSMNDKNNKTFKVYQKKNGSNEYQSISATNFNGNQQVKVLNIYPPHSKTETFTTWKGETVTLPISASLKRWMEEPNSEHPKGYGKGIISVDAVNIDTFNANPNSYLQNADGTYKYDVIMFGSLDSNGGKDLNTSSYEATKKFIDSGRGVLFGHDTVSQWGSRVNFPKLETYINVKTYAFTGSHTSTNSPSDIWTMPWSGGKEVSVNKKGTLTNYPWIVGDIGTKLSIPYTHTNSQVAKGDVWMKFTNPTPDSNVPIDTNEYSDNGVGTNMAYLTTYNNTAMIQTGHAIGRYDVTSDEQKLLANTLFYLNQLSSDNFLDDNSGQDVNPPNKPVINSHRFTDDGYIEMNYSSVVDNGSKYSYYVESSDKSGNSMTLSNVVEKTITSGLKGYSFVIDNNPNTIPDNIIETSTTETIRLKADNSKELYVHIKAIDKAGNSSETYHYRVTDMTKPTIKVTQNPSTWTNGSVTLNAIATDTGSGVKYMVLPNGNKVSASNVSYTVNKNGVYYFRAVDYMGNETSCEVIVSNIDKKKPTVTITNNQNWTNKDVQVNISSFDE